MHDTFQNFNKNNNTFDFLLQKQEISLIRKSNEKNQLLLQSELILTHFLSKIHYFALLEKSYTKDERVEFIINCVLGNAEGVSYTYKRMYVVSTY